MARIKHRHDLRHRGFVPASQLAENAETASVGWVPTFIGSNLQAVWTNGSNLSAGGGGGGSNLWVRPVAGSNLYTGIGVLEFVSADFVVSNPAAAVARIAHSGADKDGGPNAIHHTLGTGANQSAAGNHGHGGAAGTALGIFGDASDGTADLDGTNTVAWATKSGSAGAWIYTMTRDAFLDDLTVQSTVTLYAHNSSQGAAYRLFVRGTLTNDGTIRAKGADAAGATQGGALNSSGVVGGAAAGAVGRINSAGVGNGSSADLTVTIGAQGGAGGGAGANAGGSAGGAAASGFRGGYRAVPMAVTGAFFGGGTAVMMQGGRGGGGGASNSSTTTSSGGGGGGGGILVIVANAIINTGTITAAGGNGGNASSSSGGAAGGGGGGGGGAVFLTYYSLSNSGTITAAGGTKGAGINGGSDGVDGNAGPVVQLAM